MSKLDTGQFAKLVETIRVVTEEQMKRELNDVDRMIDFKVRKFIREEMESEIRAAVRAAVKNSVQVDVRMKESAA